MSMAKDYSGLKKRRAVIPPYSTESVFFENPFPNYFRVHNHGNSTIYCGTNNIPNQYQYDFAVSPDQLKAYAEPFERSVLFIFNPSGSEIEVDILSFNAEFNPLALILSDISLDFGASSLELDNVIDSFNCSLPAGNNKIGKVALEGALPEGVNNIGKVTVENMVGYTQDLSQINSSLLNLATKVDSLYSMYAQRSGAPSGETGAVGERAYSIKAVNITEADNINEMNPLSIGSTNSKIYLHMISNDSEENMAFVIGNGLESGLIWVAPGEALCDLPCDGSVMIAGCKKGRVLYHDMTLSQSSGGEILL